MARRLFNTAAIGSATLTFVVLVAWLFAGFVNPCHHFVSFSDDCHFSIAARGVDARLEVFNNAEYGPYGGSVVGFVGSPNLPTVSGIGDFAGIYFRRLQWPNGDLIWTLSLSLVYPLLISVVLPAIWLARRRRQRFLLGRI